MNQDKHLNPKFHLDRIVDGDTIILNGQGRFPKRIIIVESGKKTEYRMVKTRNGAYILNK